LEKRSATGEQDEFLSKLRSLSVEEGAEMCRVVAADVREHQARKQITPDGAAA
jgi:hypothetical protein